MAAGSNRRDKRPGSDDDSDYSEDSDSFNQESKGSMAKQEGKEGIGVKLEDEMNNDHLQKLQEIFEVTYHSNLEHHVHVCVTA